MGCTRESRLVTCKNVVLFIVVVVISGAVLESSQAVEPFPRRNKLLDPNLRSGERKEAQSLQNCVRSEFGNEQMKGYAPGLVHILSERVLGEEDVQGVDDVVRCCVTMRGRRLKWDAAIQAGGGAMITIRLGAMVVELC
ncbi:hypothetical protein K402DRAFT_395886 [Aulographum hederae CBS 113979]|uniref:Uncharacterized protein n=1 Tax=Aulographum hederae CBS 113979 TaxID=1176131 RepID=A0A6G1GTW3_9PEZI|nr:hypothetical protein K402DRAFT_395886 [Aulographum hederae CBS 113979]